ncbi:hypothetical protein LTS08_006867 [Lithohypha guttulata]|nr:hypothetical protein LTS08_006867 [Lithohypha guttulata]
MADCSSQITSQVAFYTQAPFSSGSDGSMWDAPTTDKSAKRLPPDTPPLAEDIVNNHDELLPTPMGPALPSHSDDNSEHGDPVEDHGPPSSDQSIECQPIFQAQEQDPAAATNSTSSAQHHLQGPFTLLDWIRKIRSEPPKRYPSVPLRWAKSIPKRQREILDRDETWVPPLAGLSARPGTLPADILDNLVKEANQAVPVVASVDVQPTQVQTLRDVPDSTQASSDSTGSPASVESDEETVNPTQWSLSPPERHHRRQSPPLNQHNGRAHCEPTSAGDTLTKSQQFSMHTEPPAVSTRLETTKAASADDPSLSQDQSFASYASSSSKSVAQAFSRPTSFKRKSYVQVKHTPYHPKAATTSGEHISTPKEYPHSTFVGATYPDASLPTTTEEQHTNQRPTHKQHYLRPTVESCTSYSSQPLAVHTPRQDREVCHTAQPAAQTVHWQLSADVNRSKDVQSISVTSTPASSIERDASGQPVAKRPKIAYVDPAYAGLDQERILFRRMHRQSTSSRRPTTHQETHQKAGNTVKMASRSSPAPPLLAKHGRAGGMEAYNNPNTGTQHHESTAEEHPVSSRQSRPSLPSLNNQDSGSVFTRYKHVYKTYPGDEKCFMQTLRTLLKLRSAQREPHPYLWDDFVYRYAGEYKAYVQRRLDDNENVVAYQDYYHTDVRGPERSKGIVTENVLDLLESGHFTAKPGCRSTSSRPSYSISSKNDENNVAVRFSTDSPLEVHRADSDIDQPEPGPTEERSLEADKAPANSPLTSAGPGGREQQHSSAHATVIVDANHEKKRRILPWKSTSEKQPTSSPMRPAVDPEAPSRIELTSSSKVQKWLLSSREDGAASPGLQPVQLSQDRMETMTDTENDVRRSDGHARVQVRPRIAANTVTAPEHPPTLVSSAATQSSVFEKFTDAYARLPEERNRRLKAAKQSRIPIDVHQW